MEDINAGYDAPLTTTDKAFHAQLTPEQYGARHLTLLTSSDRNDVRSALHSMLPTAWPGVPMEAMLGFTTVAESITEDTACTHGPRPGERCNRSFHEVGYFQTPAGPYAGPAPNPDPRAHNNAWTALSDDAFVTRLLGRNATTVPGAWKFAPRDQTAVGLADLHGGMRAVSRNLGGAGVTDESTTWAVALGFGAFSAGATPIIHRVKPYIGILSLVPEKQRFSRWGELLDASVRAGGKTEPLHHYLSMWRKLESGRQAAHKLGHGAAFDAWYDVPTIDPKAWVAMIGDTTSSGGGGSAAPSSNGASGSLVALVVIGVAGYLLSHPGPGAGRSA